VRPYPLTVLNGGINRQRIKGGASAAQLYDLTNAFITNAGSIVPRDGTLRYATLDTTTVGLAASDGIFYIFSSQFSTATPAGFELIVLQDPTNPAAAVEKIWFAKPFLGFEYVVAEFSDGLVFHYWLQNDGTWTSSTVYTSASIVLPPVANGLAYQGVRDFPTQPLWTPETVITSGQYVEPNSPTGFAYQAVAVAGSPSHTGQTEPVWPITSGAIIQEFGDFDESSSDSGGFDPYTTASPLSTSLTDRYGDSATIANAGVYVTGNATLSTLVLASTKIKTWTAGTTQVPGSVVVPTTNQGAFTNAISDGDFSAGTGWTFSDVGGAGEWAFGTGRPYVGLDDIEIVGGTSLGSDGAYATMATGSAVKAGTSVTTTAYLDPNNSGAALELWVQLNWYNSAYTLLSFTRSAAAEGGGYRPVSVTGVAPASAAFVAVAIRAGSGTTSRNTGYAGLVSWSLEQPAAITNFIFEAVQPAAGITSATEPTWPTVLGNTVLDGTVTWEAIGTSIITWEAIPLMMSGLTTPSFPTTIGNTVHDYSTFSNINGHITTTSMSWQATSRQVIDTGDPNTVAVTIGASHVFAGDNDIVAYSAAVNPIDWSSTNNAGYLPTGLNNYGDNPVTALALYRGNLIVFNAGGYQMWQIDPDPQNMAFLDAQPVGCIWTRSCQSVANDLIFLTEVGVRNLGTIGATANMAIGNTGQPVDPLILAQIEGTTTTSGFPFDPYFSSVSLLLFNGASAIVDQSSNNQTIASNVGPVTISTSTTLYGPTAKFNGANYGYMTFSITTASPNDIGTGDFTLEGWLNFPSQAASNGEAYIVNFNNVGASNTFTLYVTNGATPFLEFATNSHYISTNSGFALNTWFAFAIVASGATMAMYLNGNYVAAAPTGARSTFGPGTLTLGGFVTQPTYYPYNGYMADLRITKGIARYSITTGSSYTPNTSNFYAITTTTYDPFTIYYPGRGQYWLIFGPQVFVLTINGLQGTKSWSRYIFPQAITDATLNSGSLFLRTTGNTIWQVITTAGVDDVNMTTMGTDIISTIQWPYLDMGLLGMDKMLIGVDLVGDGSTTIQIGYNQTDKSSFSDSSYFTTSTSVTAPYFVAIDDTVPGTPLPIPINAPSYSLVLTFDGGTITTPNAWTWEAANFYLAPSGGAK
jgi:hypothetical protein